MTFRDTATANAATAEIYSAFCIGVDTPRSLKAHLLLKYGEREQFAKMRVHPLEYNDADSFAVDYAVVNFLKKNASLPKVCDTRAAALAAFKSSEDRCKATNQMLDAWMSGSFCANRSVVEVIHLAQRKISRLLASDPDLCDSRYSWGPGATYDMRRAKAYPDSKLVELPFTVTGGALSHAARMIDSDLHWKEAIIRHNPDYTGPIFRVIPGGRYDTVAKTVLTDRSILVEPRLNSVLQKRIGSQLRGLLRRVGVDLDDQSRNQALAAFARDCGYATLDLEAASDTVSRKLVELLLPPSWFEVLDALRSPWVQIDGDWARLEKFSSMGNGFTFELESLIFWSLASAAAELSLTTTLGVYGDDIIVHRTAAPLLIDALSFCGFSLNKEKSFIEGEFFESCGKHYYGRTDVTPLYQKESPVDGPSAVRMGNRILRFAARLGGFVALDKRVASAWACWRRRYEISDEHLGPFIGEGDGYVEAPASAMSTRIRLGPYGPRIRVLSYALNVREIPACEEAMLSLWFSSAEVREREWWEPCKRTLTFTVPNTDAAMSLTGTESRVVKRLSSVESGNLPSRVKPRYVKQHRWVEMTLCSTALDW